MTTATNSVTPLYVRFAAALLERCAQMGLEPQRAATETGLPQNKGYFFVRFGSDPNAAAMIVPKFSVKWANVHLHVDLTGLPGAVALPKYNGRVLCHFAPDLDLICEHVLPRLPGASKRPVAAPVRPTLGKTVTPPLGIHVGHVARDVATVDRGYDDELEAEFVNGLRTA